MEHNNCTAYNLRKWFQSFKPVFIKLFLINLTFKTKFPLAILFSGLLAEDWLVAHECLRHYAHTLAMKHSLACLCRSSGGGTSTLSSHCDQKLSLLRSTRATPP